MMRRAALPSSGLYPLAVLTLTFLGYGAAAAVHGSGFAAVYVAALVLGNSELPHRAATRSFAEGVAWLAQIGLFVMLGLLLSPARITLSTVGLAVVAGLVLTFVARPVSVVVSSVVQRMSWRELSFLSWAGLRGAVPIVLTTIPLAEGVDDATRLFDLVFVMVVIYTLLTGPDAAGGRTPAARWPGGPNHAGWRWRRHRWSGSPRTCSRSRSARCSRMHGVEVGELRLPEGGLGEHGDP